MKLTLLLLLATAMIYGCRESQPTDPTASKKTAATIDSSFVNPISELDRKTAPIERVFSNNIEFTYRLVDTSLFGDADFWFIYGEIINKGRYSLSYMEFSCDGEAIHLFENDNYIPKYNTFNCNASWSLLYDLIPNKPLKYEYFIRKEDLKDPNVPLGIDILLTHQRTLSFEEAQAHQDLFRPLQDARFKDGHLRTDHIIIGKHLD